MVRFGVYHEQMALCHGNGLEVPSTIPLDGLEAPEPAHGAEIPISPLTGASRRIRGVVRSTPWVLVPPDWTLRVPRTILVFSAGQRMQRRASGSSGNRLHSTPLFNISKGEFYPRSSHAPFPGHPCYTVAAISRQRLENNGIGLNPGYMIYWFV